MKKVLCFILLFLAVVGILGGIGYTIYSGAYVISVGLLAAGYVAYPGVKELYKMLTE